METTVYIHHLEKYKPRTTSHSVEQVLVCTLYYNYVIWLSRALLVGNYTEVLAIFRFAGNQIEISIIYSSTTGRQHKTTMERML